MVGGYKRTEELKGRKVEGLMDLVNVFAMF
jgi:hypothetical protein